MDIANGIFTLNSFNFFCFNFEYKYIRKPVKDFHISRNNI
jgi:hypothetical protein